MCSVKVSFTKGGLIYSDVQKSKMCDSFHLKLEINIWIFFSTGKDSAVFLGHCLNVNKVVKNIFLHQIGNNAK